MPVLGLEPHSPRAAYRVLATRTTHDRQRKRQKLGPDALLLLLQLDALNNRLRSTSASASAAAPLLLCPPPDTGSLTVHVSACNSTSGCAARKLRTAAAATAVTLTDL
jgi:hypothetical protein